MKTAGIDIGTTTISGVVLEKGGMQNTSKTAGITMRTIFAEYNPVFSRVCGEFNNKI